MNKEQEKRAKSEIAEREERILRFWRDHETFEKSLAKESPKGDYVFYDGPPFATGLPHYGHLLAGTIKDVIPRYKTMRGYHVPRRWGWDCHGLPIENLIEKELGLSTKKDIEEYGIEKFNRAARDAILRYEREWKKIIPRSGRWVDMENAYIAMDPEYMESIWWVFGELYRRGLTHEGFKAMHICPRCETTLSNFEVNQGYEETKDLSVTVTFPLKDEPETAFLAWTTTPWTLPGNVALAVGPEIEYALVNSGGERYILALDRVPDVFSGREYEMLETFPGKELVGKEYVPLFSYYAEDPELKNRENGWKVYAADFVTTEEGTGIVHIAPAFGADDMELGRKEALPFIQHVSQSGAFKHVFAKTIEGGDFAGMLVKKKGDTLSADLEIIKVLADRGRLFAKKKIIHSYPHCWRCGTPLLNYATTTWYVDVPKIKDRLIEENRKVHWVPEYVGEGRFGKWLEGVKEWALSRSRFWGTPIPVWKHPETGELLVLSSFEELLEYGKKSGNSYFGMRHGESESNLADEVNALNREVNPLTEKGREQAERAARELREKGETFDLIIASPLRRTRETAEIVARELGMDPSEIILDERIREYQIGKVYEGKTWMEYHEDLWASGKDPFWESLSEDGESVMEVYARMMEFMFDLEEKYQGKKILIVSHAMPLHMIQFGVAHYGLPRYLSSFYNPRSVRNAEIFPFPFRPFPHDERYVIDIHKPYIDEFPIEVDGVRYERTKDVFDVWFDSASMPYAQQHYPFEHEKDFLEKHFPAQFIAEGLDQTRGWFYVLAVIGNALFGKTPYENVVVNGLILAEDGKKMSKSLKNYPDPQHIFDTSGADAMRLYLLASPAVRAEPFAFSEKGVREVASKLLGRMRNSMSLYRTYRTRAKHEARNDSPSVLDRWILARLEELRREVTEGLEAYELDRATRPFMHFVDDFSTWYVRRSRDRLKFGEGEDLIHALATMRYVLREFARTIAPFAPFIAEEFWQELREANPELEESVHLSDWMEPRVLSSEEEKLLAEMRAVRELVREGLQLRADAKMKVRQPLASFAFPFKRYPEQYHEFVRAELNVKELVDAPEIFLDTELTPELIREGQERELIRTVQQLRKEAGLSPDDRVRLILSDGDGVSFAEGMRDQLAKLAGVDALVEGEVGEEGKTFRVGEGEFHIRIEKIS